jgi:hypothetical protein
MSRRLWILIEGDDDERFFNRVVRPLVEERYCLVKLWKYAQKKRQKVKGLIRSIGAMGAEFVYVKDLCRAPCVTARKGKVIEKFGEVIPADRIIIVAEEIEGWYLAGVDEATSRKLRIRLRIGSTDGITKQEFRRLIPEKASRIDSMQEMLNNYDLEMARGRNKSFGYYFDKWIREESSG